MYTRLLEEGRDMAAREWTRDRHRVWTRDRHRVRKRQTGDVATRKGTRERDRHRDRKRQRERRPDDLAAGEGGRVRQNAGASKTS